MWVALKEDRGSAERMAMLVSILGLWANKNTFVNRNDASGEMLGSRNISLRLDEQLEVQTRCGLWHVCGGTACAYSYTL